MRTDSRRSDLGSRRDARSSGPNRCLVPQSQCTPAREAESGFGKTRAPPREQPKKNTISCGVKKLTTACIGRSSPEQIHAHRVRRHAETRGYTGENSVQRPRHAPSKCHGTRASTARQHRAHIVESPPCGRARQEGRHPPQECCYHSLHGGGLRFPVPNEEGKWTEEELKTATEWLKSKGVDATCLHCNSKGATIGAFPLFLPATRDSSPVWPAVLLSCNTCGAGTLFSALRMGLALSSKDE